MATGLTVVSALDVDVPSVVVRACAKVRYSVDRKGLPGRTDAERVDQKIMGDLANDAVQAYIRGRFDLRCVSYDDVRSDEFRREDPRWDLAVGPPDSAWSDGRRDDPTRPPPTFVTLSVKSSRFPPADTGLFDVIRSRDFKIFAYSDDIKDDLHADLECQVYYEYEPSRLPAVSLPGDWSEAARGDTAVANRVAGVLGVHRRYRFPIVIGVAPYFEIIRWSNDQKPGARRYLMPGLGKDFWRAPFISLRQDIDKLPELVDRVLERDASERPRPIIE